MSEHHGLVSLSNGDLQAIDCARCGFVHLDPLPTQEALDKLYAEDYYQHHHADLFRKEKREQWYWRLVYRERLREFARLMPASSFLLDYGAGFGWFVEAAEQTEILTYGVEPSGYARGRASKGLWLFEEIRNFRLDWFDFELGAVHLSFVLEHVRDPLATLREIHGLLAPGGVLCIVVPHEFNPLQQRLMGHGYTPLHPHHVNYFMQDSLRQLAERAGFEVMRTTATLPVEALALWGGLDYTRWPKLGIVAHWLRMLFEATLLVVAPRFKRRLFERFARRGIGREIELWLRRKDD